ncbi:hypothetical protein [Stutzerimonas stutzeri]|uniref:hypothetical protein n=1 Tax=Stutzerimonas stutzeri TaxID=316 RepID=UPI0030A1AF89
MPKVYPFAVRQQQSESAKAANLAYFMAVTQAHNASKRGAPTPTSGWEKWSCRAVAFAALAMIPTILLGLWVFANGR